MSADSFALTELVEALAALHAPRSDARGRTVCDHCEDLCHSRSGLACEDPDGAYPCETVKILLRMS